VSQHWNRKQRHLRQEIRGGLRVTKYCKRDRWVLEHMHCFVTVGPRGRRLCESTASRYAEGKPQHTSRARSNLVELRTISCTSVLLT